MTKLQKRVYLLILRVLMVLLYDKLINSQHEAVSESPKLAADITEAMDELREAIGDTE